MQDNEWHAWRPPGKGPAAPSNVPGRFPKTPLPETKLHELFIEVNRKIFDISLKENAKGRFLRITEEKDGRRNSVIVPGEALEEFLTVVIEMVRMDKATPSLDQPS